jgi:SAM-dependent methyltransferase
MDVPHSKTQTKTPTIGLASYETLCTYYNSVLNADRASFNSSNDEPTPIVCVEEMINAIDPAQFTNPSLRWYDPCCGTGNFHLVIAHRLLKHHSLKHVLENMLFFNDINIERLEIVRTVFRGQDYAINISTDDFLQCKSVNKYDIIVANPPFAKLLPDGRRAAKNHNLIQPFLTQALGQLRSGGLLLFITPDSWMSCADRNKVPMELTQRQILHIDIHSAKRHFPHVGSSFTWYLVQNVPACAPFSISGVWRGTSYTSTIDSYPRKFIPLYYTRLVDSIFQKTVQADNRKFAIETSCDLHKYTKRNLIRAETDAEHTYRLFHTAKQIVYASRPHRFQAGYKVFISTTSYYSTFVDDAGMTQSIAFIRCATKAEAEQIKFVLDHPLYVFLNNVCRWGNFNNIRILQQFPSCARPECVYESFNITPDEQKIIETMM